MRKIITGTHSGTGWWLVQRISAVIVLLAGGGLMVGFWRAQPFDYATWEAALQRTPVRLLVWLLVASLCLHTWIGLRDVLMDYVKASSVRLLLHVLVGLSLVLCVAWATAILWGTHG